MGLIVGTIYIITNKIDNKKYIGQTTMGFKKRYNNDLYRNTSNIHLKNAILKYGIDNFNIDEEFDSCDSVDKLNELEKYWIEYFGGINSGKLYNFSSGGMNNVFSDEHKKTLSEKSIGRKASDETKLKMSKSQKEKNSKMTIEERKIYGAHRKGVEVLEETRKKISDAKINSKNKEEISKKISEKVSKKVICLNNNMIFNSMKEAGAFYRINPVGIGQCCNGKIKYSGLDENGIPLKWCRISGGDLNVASLV